MGAYLDLAWIRAAAWCRNKNYLHETYYAWRHDPEANGEATYRAFVAKALELVTVWRGQKFGGQDVVTEIKHDRRYAGLPRSTWGVCDNTWIRPLCIEAAARNPSLKVWLQFRKPDPSAIPAILPPLPQAIERAMAARRRSVSQILASQTPAQPPIADERPVDRDAEGFELF